MRSVIRVRALAAWGALGLLLAGCGKPSPGEIHRAELFEHYRSLVTSDFERAALADDAISRAEYHEALQRYVDCMAGRGFSVRLTEMVGGLFGYQHSGGPGFDEASAECRIGTTAVIEPLHVGLLQNPDGQPPNVAQVECLQRRGLLPRDYSVADYQADFVDDFSSYFDLSDPEMLYVFELCSYNPSM